MVPGIGVARIFDWGGGQILKNSAVFTEIESDFSAEIGNSNDFSAQNQVISKKKKKKKKVFTEIKSDFSAEIGNSDDFSAQIQVISKKTKKKTKKKKKVFTEITVMCAITEKKLQLNIVRPMLS